MNRRITVSADAKAVEEKTTAIRRRRKPRLGVGRSSDGRSAAETATEPAAHKPV